MRKLLIILWILSRAAFGREANPLVFKPGMSVAHVLPIQALDNRVTQFPADDVLAGKHDEAFVSHHDWMTTLAMSKTSRDGDYWVYVDIDNEIGEDIGLISDFPTTPNLTRVFVLDRLTRAIKRSEVVPYVLPRARKVYTLPPGHWRVYFEMKPDDFALPIVSLDLKTMKALVNRSPENHFLTLSYGICLALIAYNFVLALTLRNRAHTIYIAYNISILLYYEGRYQLLAEQFGFPELPLWSLMPINFSTGFFFLAFTAHMLGVRKNLPFWKWPLALTFLTWPFLIAYSFVDRKGSQLVLVQMLIYSAPLMIGMGVHAMVRRIPGAFLLFVSMILPALGSAVHFMRPLFSQWLPMGFIDCAQMLAFDVEMILLSMTIGFKIHREQESLRRKIDHAYTELQTIVYPHQVDQIWDGRPLVDTMPLGQRNAFIIVFDVVASSKMRIADPRGFLSRLFHDCFNLMMDNYSPERMKANGYRVKEMGDGFLCSIDFPFGCPDGNPADHSVRMAWRFLEIFREHVRRLESEQAIHCSIGVAYGPVEAFYPDSGTRVYDLFGRGIILAHRYESMRDILFRWLKQRDDIVILHQPVHAQLSEALRDEFTEVDLAASDFKVRDDEEAKTLYYQLASGRAHRQLLKGA